MNTFLSTDPLSGAVLSGSQGGATGNHVLAGGDASKSGNGQDLMQFEDRKKVVAAIYLNTMSNKISNVDARERQRRR